MTFQKSKSVRLTDRLLDVKARKNLPRIILIEARSDRSILSINCITFEELQIANLPEQSPYNCLQSARYEDGKRRTADGSAFLSGRG